jgi:AcrR family transcriptional regulator
MTMSRAPTKRTGRRPGATETREQIAEAARTLFAETGYERTSFRKIAAAAGVDPALVVHFYGSKEDLFRQVMALPPAIADALEHLSDGPRETIGQRLAELIVRALENPASRTITLGRIRCATTHPDAAALVRETVTRDLGKLAAAVTDDQPDVRAVMLGAHVVGIALARYAVFVEPLASMTPSEVIGVIAPTFQHYLVEPLTP